MPPKIYTAFFVPDLTWKVRIKRCNFEKVDPQVWKYIDSFVCVEDEDPTSVNIELDRFDQAMSSVGVESFQTAKGKKMISPARFLHLLEQHTDLPRNIQIVCTEEMCKGEHSEPLILSMSNRKGKRALYLLPREFDWVEFCRFPSAPIVS